MDALLGLGELRVEPRIHRLGLLRRLRLGFGERRGDLRLRLGMRLARGLRDFRDRRVRLALRTLRRFEIGGDGARALLDHLADERQRPAGKQQIEHDEDDHEPDDLARGQRIAEVELRHAAALRLLRKGAGGREQQGDREGLDQTHGSTVRRGPRFR